jgi:hypothetical protein
MASETAKTMRTTSVSMTTNIKEDKEPPAGAKILSKSVTTSTEQIENGWLISKNFDISYEIKGDKRWTYYSKKWYSKTDPLDIKLTDKSLADEFDVDTE